MARSRNIKPGFFKNEHLGELPPLVRLLFEALWCEADRDGRLEDRPMRLKAEYFAYDNCDMSTMLAQLEHSAGSFITRYEVGGKRYIQVNKFIKHQNPHKAEKKSTIPPPSQAVVIPKENNSTIPAQCLHRTCLVLAGLIPDSRFLIPDSEKAAASITGEGDMEEGENPKGAVEEKQEPTFLAEGQERMPVSEAIELHRDCTGKLMENGLQVTVLQDICRLYPPERIREAFQAAKAAGATKLNWVTKRLEARGRDSPSREELRRQRNLEASLEFAGGDP